MRKLPTSIKALRGTLRPSRQNPSEVQPARSIPSCPSHLDKEARKEWKRLTGELFQIGLLTEIDRTALATYCATFSLWKQAEEHLRSEGVMVNTPNGFEQPSPWLTVSRKSIELLHKLGAEFGLSPVSRSKAHPVPTEPRENKLTRFLKEFDDEKESA